MRTLEEFVRNCIDSIEFVNSSSLTTTTYEAENQYKAVIARQSVWCNTETSLVGSEIGIKRRNDRGFVNFSLLTSR